MKIQATHRLISTTLVAALLGLACADAVRADSRESEAAPVDGGDAAPQPPDQRFAIPELPQSIADMMRLNSRWFTAKFGAVLLVDYSFFRQDAGSLAQVGPQQNQWDARALRPWLSGTLGDDYRVRYLIAAEYGGFSGAQQESWTLTDLEITFPLGGPATRLSMGKIKETFVYEMVGDAANLPQQERVLNPFFVGRSVGVKLSRVIGADQRMTASVGVFNDWLETGDSLADSGTDVTARITGLPWDRNDGTGYLHLGVSGRYAGADNNTLRYRGRPGSNVTDYYVDTGDLSADHAWHLGLESLWTAGPFSVLAEYNRAWVDAPESGNPAFTGYYITGSWLLRGEARPYDRSVGYARRVIPVGRWGAPEFTLRYSHVDLDDAPVLGGKFDMTYLGVNWWANRQLKLGFGWSRTWLRRFRQTGVTDGFLTRLQWIF